MYSSHTPFPKNIHMPSINKICSVGDNNSTNLLVIFKRSMPIRKYLQMLATYSTCLYLIDRSLFNKNDKFKFSSKQLQLYQKDEQHVSSCLLTVRPNIKSMLKITLFPQT